MNRDRALVLLRTLLWAAGNSAVGAVIGAAVSLFNQGTIEGPTIGISMLFANVVGFTAMVSSVLLIPRLRGLAPPLRVLLLGLALLTGSVAGTVAVLKFYPLFVARDPLQALAIVVINVLLALIVGSVVYVYEGMRLRLQDSLHEVEKVRLVEARLREEAARAELAALQARINPHFFFNTLNTISSLLNEDPEEADEVVQRLSDLFRYTFKAADAGEVRLDEEIEFTRGYLAIEQARFGTRLMVEWDLEPDALEVPVPGLIVQPLVENAVGHGIAPRADGGVLRISARVANGELLIEVTDDGVGLGGSPEALLAKGHGLRNVRRRLETFYPGRGALVLMRNPEGKGALAELRLPCAPERGPGGRPDSMEVKR